MKLLAGIARELIGMFVDDGKLAIAIVAVIATAALVARFTASSGAGVVLLAGLLFVLFANVLAVQHDK
jgi:hypothetical protein